MTAASAGRANAAALRAQAAARESKAVADVAAKEREFVRVDGSARNKIAGSGVSTGSFSDILNDQLTQKELAIETIRWGAKNDVNNLNYQADSAKSQGDQAAIAGYIKAGSAVVGGATNYYNSSGLSKTSLSNWTTTVSQG